MAKKQHKKKQFIKRPHLEGGSEFYREYLKNNLKYPQEAIDNRIEGDVLVGFRVNYKGEVFEAHIIKGIGHGCDDEALRLVNMLKFQEVQNRGMKVTTRNKLKIPFRLGGLSGKVSIVYSIESSGEDENQKVDNPNSSESYTWTINLNSNPDD